MYIVDYNTKVTDENTDLERVGAIRSLFNIIILL